MVRKRPGSLGYQMMRLLQGIFHPGGSRYQDKRHARAGGVIRSVGTMRAMSADVHQFARFLRAAYPQVRLLREVTPEMARAYLDELIARERSGGRLGRVAASIRKLDQAARAAGVFPQDAPPLLPYAREGGLGGFHAQTDATAYTLEQAHRLLEFVSTRDPAVGRVLQLQLLVGLRVTEACYLRAQDVDLENGLLRLNQGTNANRTKGGRPREVQIGKEAQAFLGPLVKIAQSQPGGHLFSDRRSLAERARREVRTAARQLSLPPLGTHGLRKTYAVTTYREKRAGGATHPDALRETSQDLGHNRTDVTRSSYIGGEDEDRSGNDQG